MTPELLSYGIFDVRGYGMLSCAGVSVMQRIGLRSRTLSEAYGFC